MKSTSLPSRDTWPALCRRPELQRASHEENIRSIIKKVRLEGDKALRFFSEKFDGSVPDSFRIPGSLIEESERLVSENLKKAITTAKENIEKFHAAQIITEQVVETTPGVKCWRKSVPVEKVGLYIPGGSAPLFSTVLMLAVPARLAGCKEIILLTPPGKNGEVNPLILYAAKISGVTEIFRIGGAQAIAAMAFGTESVPKVDKIFGPGNQYVTKAKELVQTEGIPIDMPAGPSEVLIIADRDANPEFIAADLLSQAEHGSDSQVILLTDDQRIIPLVMAEIEKQLTILPRRDIAGQALENSNSILLGSIDECIEFSNMYAPEHLIIAVSDPTPAAAKITNAGSVFLGKYSCESAGDYATGTNHTLPTNGFARSYSGVSTESFMKKITFQQVSEEGLMNLGPAIELMAEAENLSGHRNAVSVRLKTLRNE